MNARILMVTVLLAGSVSVPAAEEKSPFLASQAEASMRGSTNIFFRESVAGKEVRTREFTVADPDELRHLTTSIRLGDQTGNKCEFLLEADFQGPAGVTSVQFNDHYFVVLESPDSKGYKDHSYAMPKEFYAQFLRLTKKHSWRVVSTRASDSPQRMSAPGPSNATVAVPPEREVLVEAARAMHLKSEFATRYPVLRRADSTGDGGYEVRFGREGGFGIIGVSYYFDASGRYTRSIRWYCDGY